MQTILQLQVSANEAVSSLRNTSADFSSGSETKTRETKFIDALKESSCQTKQQTEDEKTISSDDATEKNEVADTANSQEKITKKSTDTAEQKTKKDKTAEQENPREKTVSAKVENENALLQANLTQSENKAAREEKNIFQNAKIVSAENKGKKEKVRPDFSDSDDFDFNAKTKNNENLSSSVALAKNKIQPDFDFEKTDEFQKDVLEENVSLNEELNENLFAFGKISADEKDKNQTDALFDKTKNDLSLKENRFEITDLRTRKPQVPEDSDSSSSSKKTNREKLSFFQNPGNSKSLSFSSNEKSAVQEKNASQTSLKDKFSLSQDQKNGTLTADFDLELHAEQNITSSSQQTASSSSSTYQSMLSNAIGANAPDFVKAGNIVLKDNNQGNINLVLHPEKLGNVKISLSLSDKVISGQITVHSKEAYEAMKESIVSLKEAFSQNGFEAGEFNLSFSQNQNFAGFGNGSQNQDSAFRAEKSYSDYVTDASQDSSDDDNFSSSSLSQAHGTHSINIVA